MVAVAEPHGIHGFGPTEIQRDCAPRKGTVRVLQREAPREFFSGSRLLILLLRTLELAARALLMRSS